MLKKTLNTEDFTASTHTTRAVRIPVVNLYECNPNTTIYYAKLIKF